MRGFHVTPFEASEQPAFNAARLRSNYANLNLANCLGDFAGRLSHNPTRGAGSVSHANIVRNAMPLMTPAKVRSRLPLRFGICISSTLFQICSVL